MNEINDVDVEAKKSLTGQSSDQNGTTASCVVDDHDMDTGISWVVLVASFFTSFLLGGALYAVGIIHSALMDKYQESVALTSWAGALHTALPGLFGPLSSIVIDTYNCRTAIVISGILYFLGYMTTAFAPNIHVVIFTCGIVAGTAGGIGYTAGMVVISFNFKKKLGLALGISSAGIGLGLFCLAPVFQIIRDFYGPRGFFMMLAAIYLHLIICGLLCFPSKLEIFTKHQRKSTSLSDSKTSCLHLFIHHAKRYWNVFLQKSTLCYSFAMFAYCLGTYLIYFYLPSFIVHSGFTAPQAAFLVSLSGIIGVFGRLVSGVVVNSQRVHIVVMYAGSMVIVAIATFIYPYVAHIYACQVTYVSVVGLVLGNSFLTSTNVNLQFVEVDSISAALGIEFMIGGIGATLGPVFAGVLIDAYDSYDLPYLSAAGFTLIASFSGGVTYFFKKLPTAKYNEDIKVEENKKLNFEKSC
ncbi:hypothetical protein ACF0H5_009587 [Mactra antiquata]